MRTLHAATVAASALLLAALPAPGTIGAAKAGAINLNISDSLDGLIVNQDTLSGINTFVGSSPHFIAISALAGPSGGANLGAVTLDLTTGGTGSHTLDILVTQTGLDFDAASTETTFTFNGLEGRPGPNRDIMSVNGIPIVDHTFLAAIGVDAFGIIPGGPVHITDNAEEFQIFFAGAGERFEGTIEFIAEAVPVREASSAAILASALGGGFWAARRRRRAFTPAIAAAA